MERLTSQIIKPNGEDTDEKILQLLSQRPLCTETISILVGLDPKETRKKLVKLRKYGCVIVKTRQSMFWWGLSNKEEVKP